MSDKIRCSVIIPSYNSEATIVACLESVLTQDLAEPFEVIVVDSSSDRTPALVQRDFPMVRLIHRERRMGSGTARNLGVAIARGDILAFTDSDCMVASDWLRRMCERHDQFPGCAAVGGPIVNGNPESLVSWAGYLAEFNQFLPKDGPLREVDHIPAGNISYKRSIFEQLGGFPNEEILMQVDLFFNQGLRNLSQRFIYYDPSIRVAHMHRTVLMDYLTHQFRIGRATAQVLYRRPTLQGGTLIRHPRLLRGLLPLLPLVKFVRSVTRFLLWNPAELFKRPLVLPLFGLGLLYWVTGFAKEVRNLPCTSHVIALPDRERSSQMVD